MERIAQAEVESKLRRTGAVLIEGPKAAGKTWLARTFAKSEVRLDQDAAAREAGTLDAAFILAGENPRLLDEYQLVPGLWDAVRGWVDDAGSKGLFLLTGSSTPVDRDPRSGASHTGARRIATVRLRTASLLERGLSSGSVSVGSLLAGDLPLPGDHGRVDAKTALAALCVGGWPQEANVELADDAEVADAIESNRDYLQRMAEVDVARIDTVSRDPQRVLRLVQQWSRNTGTAAPMTTLARMGADHVLAPGTRDEYRALLERLFLVEDQPAWKPDMRSRVRVAATPRRHLADPSLAVASLGTSPAGLLGDLKLAGFLFESQVVHDLRVYAAQHRGRVLSYSDNKGAEIDAIVEDAAGRWCGFEVKLGPRSVDVAAASLRAAAGKFTDEQRLRCGALVVVTTDTPTYVREDGVVVTSAGALGP